MSSDPIQPSLESADDGPEIYITGTDGNPIHVTRESASLSFPVLSSEEKEPSESKLEQGRIEYAPVPMRLSSKKGSDLQLLLAPGNLSDTWNVYSSPNRVIATERARQRARNKMHPPARWSVLEVTDKPIEEGVSTDVARKIKVLCIMNHRYHPVCCHIGDTVAPLGHESFAHDASTVISEYVDQNQFPLLDTLRIRHNTIFQTATASALQAHIVRAATRPVKTYPFHVELFIYMHHHNVEKDITQELPNDELAIHAIMTFSEAIHEGQVAGPGHSKFQDFVTMRIVTFRDVYANLLFDKATSQAFINHLSRFLEQHPSCQCWNAESAIPHLHASCLAGMEEEEMKESKMEKDPSRSLVPSWSPRGASITLTQVESPPEHGEAEEDPLVSSQEYYGPDPLEEEEEEVQEEEETLQEEEEEQEEEPQGGDETETVQ
jgi:hypothetical protein